MAAFKNVRSTLIKVAVVLVFAFVLFFVWPNIKREIPETPTLPEKRSIVRLELDRNWSQPVTAPPGKCIWYSFVYEPEGLRSNAQRQTPNGWEFWERGEHWTTGTNRFRAAYNIGHVYYEIREPGFCNDEVEEHPNTHKTYELKLTNNWSYGIRKQQVGTLGDYHSIMLQPQCIKWWGDDSQYQVQSNRWKASNEWVDWNPSIDVQRVRFRGIGRGSTVFYEFRPDGMCKD